MNPLDAVVLGGMVAVSLSLTLAHLAKVMSGKPEAMCRRCGRKCRHCQ